MTCTSFPTTSSAALALSLLLLGAAPAGPQEAAAARATIESRFHRNTAIGTRNAPLSYLSIARRAETRASAPHGLARAHLDAPARQLRSATKRVT